MRKLVSVQTVESVTPIDGADRIEAARILGWTVVVGKDLDLKPGDKVAYYETDSLLPATDPRYAEFAKRGVKTMAVDGVDVTGHVLKTMRLRGVVSQGLVMRLEDAGVDPATMVGTDITREAGVLKWEPPLPVGSADIIGPFDAPCAKSDATRIQSLEPWWDELKSLAATPTVKVDGTSVTLYRDMDGRLHVYSRNWETAPTSPGMRIAVETGIADALEPGMVCQYELCGPGVQANRLKLSALRPFVFAVWRNHTKLDRDRWSAVMLEHAAPMLDAHDWALDGSLDDMIARVSALRGAVTRDRWDEGVVWHLHAGQAMSPELARELGDNRCVKIISNKYLLKHRL